jgi:hypothetical protein
LFRCEPRRTPTLRTTVIGGIRYADDYAVVWRGLSIGRIMKAIGAASDKDHPVGISAAAAIVRKEQATHRPGDLPEVAA